MAKMGVHGQWSSSWAFILAAAGSAVGIGNVWRFSYVAGENGGGAFVLAYIVCVLLLGLPIMIAEIMIGRRARQNPIGAIRLIAMEEGRSRHWSIIGWLGVATGVSILSYYSVVAGWVLHYVFLSVSGWGAQSQDGVGELFGDLLGSPGLLLLLHTVFMGMTVTVQALGVQEGLERSVKLLMPALFGLLLLMVGYGLQTPGFGRSVEYLFRPDFPYLLENPSVFLVAMGQAFFSLSVGMGALIAYGAYLPEKGSIVRMAGCVAALDTLVAVLAGLMIFPLVFSYGLEPAQGVGLIFKVLPIAFGQMPWGALFSVLFFLLLSFAAWTSAISILEPAVAWLIESRGWSRFRAAVTAGGTAWLLGVGALLSFNLWQQYQLLGKTFFDWLDYLTTNIMLPLGALLIALFAGWRISRRSSREELGLPDGLAYRSWRLAIRFLAPVGFLAIFLHASGILDLGG
ncbi:MAG: sodium-dependent transporter [Gammaproteobacteria bacterium]|nr:sodium-dependent transporter [Gammaproteobacteria bacterium]